MQALTDLRLSGLKVYAKGKVRDVYDLGDKLLIVATDRISAFDYVLQDGIPDKGKILTAMSAFWFHKLENVCGNHLLSDDVDEFPEALREYGGFLRHRSMLVRKAKRIDVECIVRGYLSGSAWKQYSQTGMVGEYKLALGLSKDARLERPIFTPTTKAQSGHDEDLTIRQMCEIAGSKTTEQIIAKSLLLYSEASEYASKRGITILDTKFEFGYVNGDLILIDEILTPDSSRFLVADEVGLPPINLDKQFIRDFLESTGWDRASPPPRLPEDIVKECRRRYVVMLERLLGGLPEWAK